MAKITINGNTFEVSGNNVSIINGTVRVDGNVVVSGLSGGVNIKWEGGLASLTTDSSVTCTDIHGSVNAGGSVHCNDISGSVSADGSVKASGHIGKQISAGGSVKIGY